MLVKKITHGYVVQIYDTEAQAFVSQDFVAGDECEYEDENDNPVDRSVMSDELGNPKYLAYTMVQP